MKIHAFKPFGAIISGVDVKHATPEQIEQFKQALWDHKVLSFTDQNLNFDDMESVAKIFGNIYDHPIDTKKGPSTHKNIQLIEREKTDDFLFGGYWHSDHACIYKRPSYTMLFSITIPKEGGETYFIDNQQMYDSLPKIIQEQLDNATTTNFWVRNTFEQAMKSNGKLGFGASLLYNKNNYNDEEIEQVKHNVKIINFNQFNEDFKNKTSLVKQHAVLTHPRTNKKCLNITPAMSVGFEDMDSIESEKLMQTIFSLQINSDLKYKLNWNKNMLTIWDNRQLLHVATPSSDEPRIIYRVMINDPIDLEKNIYYN